MTFPETIFDYIVNEENDFKTGEVNIFDNYSWNFANHVQMSVSFKQGKFLNASNDPKFKPPFKNIVLPTLRLRYRAEDIDVKDVVLYIEEPEKHHLSFLVKKYHDDVFVIENDLDSFFDKAKEEKIDLGGVLVKRGKILPEVVHLQSIAFCDQMDIMSGPIALKSNFSPDKLRGKTKLGWGDKKNGATISIEELIALAKQEKGPVGTLTTRSNKTPGKNIEVYIVRGQMPERYLQGNKDDLVSQVQIVGFYYGQKGRKGVTLYKALETEEVYKFHNPEEVYNRALGIGGVEEIFDAQIWTNFAEIHKTNMLKAASKVVLQTTDEAYATRNKIIDMDNLEVTVTKEGTRIDQVPTGSANIQLFNQSLNEWEVYAKEITGATDPLLGKQPPAGTPFRLQERVVFEGKGLHDYRRGRFAKFIEEIYRDWIIPQIAKEIVKGKTFLTNFTPDEMQFVMEKVSSNRAAKTRIEQVLDGKIPEDLETLKQKERDALARRGNQHFIEILKDELKDVQFKVKVNVSGKQKDLALMADKWVNILRQYFATPQMRQDPIALKLLNRIMESSGLPSIDFSSIQLPNIEQSSITSTSPLKELSAPKPELVTA